MNNAALWLLSTDYFVIVATCGWFCNTPQHCVSQMLPCAPSAAGKAVEMGHKELRCFFEEAQRRLTMSITAEDSCYNAFQFIRVGPLSAG